MKKFLMGLCLITSNFVIANPMVPSDLKEFTPSNETNFFSLEAEKFATTPTEKLHSIHSRLHLIHGSFAEEYPEQLMAAAYLPNDAKVLELGGNVGRNSCVIAAILDDAKNLVVVEPSEDNAAMLAQNRDVNGLEFYIEASAVSKVPLVQSGWVTLPSEEDVPGFVRVKTITFDEIQEKYQTQFDTLVVDCEGALYYMLKDDPEILKNIKTIIIENDFTDINHFMFVQQLFIDSGLSIIYNEAGGWGPCYSCFYQVWKKL